jgi:peptide chain release factor subunit 1
MPELLVTDRLDSLARLEPTRFPLLSVYLNTGVGGTGRPLFDAFLRKELRERMKTYPSGSEERESFERDVKRIEEYVSNELAPSTRGMALFACAGADLFDPYQFKVAFDRDQLIVSDRPHLYPLARLDDQYPRYAAVVVTSNSARIVVCSAGAAVNSSEIWNPKTKHIKSGGWSQARFQRHVENMHLEHAKEVVDRLDAIVAADHIHHVVVSGDEVIVPMLKHQLPERLAGKVIDVSRIDIRSPEHEVLAVTLEALRRNDEEGDEAVVRDLIDEYRAGGLAVVGARRTREALRRGQVDTLVITATPDQVEGADETVNELVILARQTSASLRFIENPAALGAVGGVGARLRYLT